jgi:hypothetical protein
VLAAAEPGCQLHWPVLAAIGRAESGHAQGGRFDAAGRTLGRLLGPRLDGSAGLPRVPDTDRGELDGDSAWDRAVGPMQLLPSAWQRYRADGDGDGRTDPNDVYDAALTAARYLCAGGFDLADPGQLDAALLRYRHSTRYVSTVRQWAASSAAPTPGTPTPGAGTAPRAARPPAARRAPAIPRPVAVGPAPGARPPRAVSKLPTAVPEQAAGAQRPAVPERAARSQRPVVPERAAGSQRPAVPEQAPTLPAAPQAGDASDRSGYVIVIPEPAPSEDAPTTAGPNRSRTGGTGGTDDDTEAGGADPVDGDTGGSPTASAETGSSSVPWPTTAR